MSDKLHSRSKESLRLWLRLIACENFVEHRVRGRMREQFGITLPQFDVMAELEHVGRPLNMTELSTQLMVSNGNVTGVVDRLVREGFVKRTPSEQDRRAHMIELTDAGMIKFRDIASHHEGWVKDLFAGLTSTEISDLLALLNRTYDELKKQDTARG
jgi:DNA-binding MarR family transcriptional regulator